MFERFTAGARQAVVLAQEEARTLGHPGIGPEHILLGLLHDGGGVAKEALESLGVRLETARQQVVTIAGRGTAVSGNIPFTPAGKAALAGALREALRLGHNYIGAEHILLGLAHEDKGVIAQVLAGLGTGPAQVRRAVLELVRGGRPGAEAALAAASAERKPRSGLFRQSKPAAPVPQPTAFAKVNEELEQFREQSAQAPDEPETF
jgi:ATP-dependent Clp protease ATP-binding subunit ClpC